MTLVLTGCDGDSGRSSSESPQESGRLVEVEQSAVDLAVLRPQVEQFCGDCHGTPAPDTFPRHAWLEEVQQGYRFYYASGRHDLDPPAMNDVVAFFRAQAPDELIVPQPPVVDAASSVVFRREPVSCSSTGDAPAISYVKWWTPPGEPPALFVCDMRNGDVLLGLRQADRFEFEQLPLATNPAHLHPTDLDNDGEQDFVVAELGSYEPADHDRGRVVWLRRDEDGWIATSLLEDVGRVADVRSADFDGDGDLDLVVAEFGWRNTGRILLLEQTGVSNDVPAFDVYVLDDRHGTIHVPVCDLNHDGHPDFVALVSQEHEVIDVFLGRGDGSFDRERIHAAGDPSWGSSGIQLVDFDGDGDDDVLYTNGDTMDSLYLKPQHSIQWLENTGAFPFVRHELLQMPGVYRAVAADMDSDGDQDVVACAYFLDTRGLLESQRSRADSLLWLEQLESGEFARHPLAMLREEGFMTLDVGDFDADGRPDIATGHFDIPDHPRSESLSIWWNEPGDRAATLEAAAGSE